MTCIDTAASNVASPERERGRVALEDVDPVADSGGLDPL